METYHNIGTSTDWIIMLSYFLIVMLFGSYFGKYNRSTKDFFFGGRRFAWWLIAFSIVATGVGSHSFVKYSAKGFEHGLSSTMTYLNDWFFMPLFMFGWLPIIVYSKIKSIPEYFERRFSPTARFLATILLLMYMIGYIGIGFLTLGKAAMPMLPESFSLFGSTIPITLMGVITVIAVVIGIYITFGGQTAVIFTDLLQGAILLFAGLLLFFIGLHYVGGFDVFWNILPKDWKIPLGHFNKPPDFNFVGIFWQDGIAGSIGFLFMNMGLIMRFMATKSVDEGRKAAAFNVLFMLPISAIVVGNAGWIGKAISLINPHMISPNTSPDEIFVVVSNIVSSPGVFGFIMAALTAALMSTVDTLVNATAAIYINDIYRPVKSYMKKMKKNKREEDKVELFAARYSSAVITALGVVSVLAFKNFPTVYEAHGYFHSTLTPPLVVAIFLGIFWKKITPSGVITTFIVGVSLMILGAYYPGILIKPVAWGIKMDPAHPYTYIRAFYNLLVCAIPAVIVTYTTIQQKNIVKRLKENGTSDITMYILGVVSLILFILISLNTLHLIISFVLIVVLLFTVPILVTFFGHYDEEAQLVGMTAWDLPKAKEMFKGSKLNNEEGEVIKVNWKLKDNEEETLHFSKNDMARMKANVGDLVYICDARKYLGGLKSIHSVYGEPHDEDGIVYITNEELLDGVFIDGKILTAEKEM